MNASRWLALSLCLVLAGAVSAEEPAALERRMRDQLKRQPNDRDARFQLARALSWQERHDDALAEYARLLKARPDNVDYLLGAAQTHLWRGAPAAALPLLKEARRRAPHYADIWRVQIQALIALGDTERIALARSVRDEANRRFPTHEWRFAALDAATPKPVAALPPPAPVSAVPSSAEATPPSTPAPSAPSGYDRPATPPTVAAEPGRLVWEASFARERLSRDLPSWSEERILGEWHLPGKALVYGGLRATERYRLADTEVHLGGVLPVTEATRAQVEAGASDSHRVLPARYLALHLHFLPAPGWGLLAGLRRSEYDTGATHVASFGADRYLGAERFGYTLYLGGPDGSGRTPSHRLQWTHSYGDNDWIGLSLVRGRETEHAANGFLTSRVRAATLNGRHHLTPDWALVWEAGVQFQGDLYTRRGARLGLRHTF